MALADVHFVAGSPANCYLIEGDGIFMAVDVGMPSTAYAIVDYFLRKLRRSLTDLKFVTCTHYHIDHIGGIPMLLNIARHIKVLLPIGSRRHIEKSVRLIFPPWKRKPRVVTGIKFLRVPMPNLFDLIHIPLIGLPIITRRNPPFPIHRYIDEGDVIDGLADWQIFSTPGHSPDSLCFWNPKTGSLLSGDTILGAVKGPMLNYYHHDTLALASSGLRLKALPIYNLYAGHGKSYHGLGILREITATLIP